MELLNILVQDLDTDLAVSAPTSSTIADVSGCIVLDIIVQCEDVSGGADIDVTVEQSQFSAGPWFPVDTKNVTADANLDFSFQEPPSGRFVRVSYAPDSGTMTVVRTSILGKGPV